MSRHYDVHLIHVVHVVLDDDTPDPEEGSIEQAAEEFRDLLDSPDPSPWESDFWVTDKQDVYPVDPCDCEN